MTMTAALLEAIRANPLLAIALWFGCVIVVFPWFEAAHNLRDEL